MATWVNRFVNIFSVKETYFCKFCQGIGKLYFCRFDQSGVDDCCIVGRGLATPTVSGVHQNTQVKGAFLQIALAGIQDPTNVLSII